MITVPILFILNKLIKMYHFDKNPIKKGNPAKENKINEKNIDNKKLFEIFILI
jgi:hypothetical protein